jgi:hypothetical protein
LNVIDASVLVKRSATRCAGRFWQGRSARGRPAKRCDNVSFYDGLYVALAEGAGSPLLTFDGRLSRASGLPAEVELIGAGS